MAAIFCGSVAGNFYFPNNLFTSDERIGAISRTAALLFPKSATASNSAIGEMIFAGSLFVSTWLVRRHWHVDFRRVAPDVCDDVVVDVKSFQSLFVNVHFGIHPS